MSTSTDGEEDIMNSADLATRIHDEGGARFHTLNASMFELAMGSAEHGMSAFVRLQAREFALEAA